jgi:hypothetical protein
MFVNLWIVQRVPPEDQEVTGAKDLFLQADERITVLAVV